MTRKRKVEGKAIARILDARTHEIVGYLFEWNTGDIGPKWNDDIPRERGNVVYEYPDLYTMRSEDDDLGVGIIYAKAEATLRLFGSSYMQDKQASGTLKITDPQGVTIATFDIWQNKWVEPADTPA